MSDHEWKEKTWSDPTRNSTVATYNLLFTFGWRKAHWNDLFLWTPGPDLLARAPAGPVSARHLLDRAPRVPLVAVGDPLGAQAGHAVDGLTVADAVRAGVVTRWGRALHRHVPVSVGVLAQVLAPALPAAVRLTLVTSCKSPLLVFVDEVH